VSVCLYEQQQIHFTLLQLFYAEIIITVVAKILSNIITS